MPSRSEHAQTAAMIRRELKIRYPHTEFRVTSKSYSGGSSVRVSWTDGPTYADVAGMLGKYEQGRFDGSDDTYHYVPSQDNIPRVKYAEADRRQSDATRTAIVEHLNRTRGYALVLASNGQVQPDTDHYTGNGWASHEIGQTFAERSLICSACRMSAEFPDRFCAECGALLTGPED